jgi:hypothetical protein
MTSAQIFMQGYVLNAIDTLVASLTTNGWLLEFKKFIADEADNQTRLSNGGVTQKNQLEMMNARIGRVADSCSVHGEYRKCLKQVTGVVGCRVRK